MLPTFARFYGVDFSGAKLAGRNIWVAGLVPGRRRLRLLSVDRLHTLAGTAERTAAHAHLADLILSSQSALWGMDFPFGLPRELFPPRSSWASQFEFLKGWEDEAYACGLEFVRRARGLCPDTSGTPHRTALHCRRLTDVEARAPFDTFHYRKLRGLGNRRKLHWDRHLGIAHSSHETHDSARFPPGLMRRKVRTDFRRAGGRR